MPSADGASAGQVITVGVPSVAILKVDRNGHVMAAKTNTGCAPRVTDMLYFVQADGSLRQGSADDLTNRRWTGDFTQIGVYVAQ